MLYIVFEKYFKGLYCKSNDLGWFARFRIQFLPDHIMIHSCLVCVCVSVFVSSSVVLIVRMFPLLGCRSCLVPRHIQTSLTHPTQEALCLTSVDSIIQPPKLNGTHKMI